MDSATRKRLKDLDIELEEKRVLVGRSDLPHALRVAVLERAAEIRETEALLDRNAVHIFQRLINKAPLSLRIKIASDVLRGQLGNINVRKPKIQENKNEIE